MENIGETLKAHWLSYGTELMPGVPQGEISAFEQKYEVVMPPDLKDYYLSVGGFVDGDMDEELLSFIPFSDIAKERRFWIPEGPEKNSLFMFADFLISSHAYLIQLFKNPSVINSVFVAYGNVEPIKVANSFSEFIRGYLGGENKMLHPQLIKN